MDTQLNESGAFRSLLAKTASATGLEFFRILTKELAQAVGVNYALVSQMVDRRAERARTVAFFAGGTHTGNFEYDLAGTPCENALVNGVCFYGEDVASKFPEDRPLVEMGIESYLGVPLRDGEGNPIGILAAFNGAPMEHSEELITIFNIFAARAGLELERMRIQTMLEASEKRFRALLESGTDLILALDRDGKIQYASPSCFRFSGFHVSEALGRSAFEFVAPEDRATLLDLFCNAIKRPEPGPFFETRIQRKDGSWIDVESRANQIMLSQDDPGLVLNCRDISERKQAERRLRFENALLETQSECSPDGVLALSPDGKTLHANRRFAEIWRLPVDQRAKWSAEFVWSEIDAQGACPGGLRQAAASALKDAQSTFRETWVTRDSRSVEVYSAPLRQESGACFGRLWSCRDVTEQVRLRERLYHSQRVESLGKASAGMAHEFKNLLGPILGNTELASLELPETHSAQKWLKQVVKSALSARDLVQQLLTFARQGASSLEPANLGEVVVDGVRLLRTAVPKSVEIEKRVAENLPKALLDSNQIKQIVMNLGLNAWHAMADGAGMISISVEMAEESDPNLADKPAEAGWLRVSVKDNGHGMDAETAARLFEPFFTTKPAGQGTGLGLSVAHGIVQAHNGFITVASSPGAGATFAIYFPALRETI